MLSKSDFELGTAVRLFSLFGKDSAFLVPTETGIKKSILDAPYSLRKFFSDNNIHDFESQLQGPENKVVIEVGLVGSESISWRDVSLYRPTTKSGDPRIWISRLGEYARPWNLLGFFVGADNQLYVLNFSNDLVRRSIDLDGSPANLALSAQTRTSAADELHELLRVIHDSGPVKSMRAGSTGIGFTLESLLGIAANSSKSPDYKGIEVKSGRRRVGVKPTNRSTLFSRVPDWKISALKSGLEILNEFGYASKHTGRLELYCTISNRPNPQGLFIEIDEVNDRLVTYGQDLEGQRRPVVQWDIEKLIDALKTKHAETFWVSAVTTIDDNGEEIFHYDRYVHTRAPLVSNFRSLLSLGVISVDYTLSLIGPKSVNDHGYIFKILPKDFHLLFPLPREVGL